MGSLLPRLLRQACRRVTRFLELRVPPSSPHDKTLLYVLHDTTRNTHPRIAERFLAVSATIASHGGDALPGLAPSSSFPSSSSPLSSSQIPYFCTTIATPLIMASGGTCGEGMSKVCKRQQHGQMRVCAGQNQEARFPPP